MRQGQAWWAAAARYPTGRQLELRRGDQVAVIAEVGATLRSYRVADRELLDPFPPDALPSGSRGQLLVPWPNRLADGAYSFAGAGYQLPLNEPGLRNAIHGLARGYRWRLLARRPSAVTLGLVLPPQSGYPFLLALTQSYALSATGLRVRTRARNVGQTAAPFGVGQHPYFTVGTPRVDTALLHVPASGYLVVDERLLPTARAAVAGTEYDFRRERPIGGTVLDTCLTDLQPDGDGRVRIGLAHPDGAPRLQLTLDAAYAYVQVYSGDTLEDPAARRRALAIEPMTCAPNAFNSGAGLRLLAPGEMFAVSWEVALHEQRA